MGLRGKSRHSTNDHRWSFHGVLRLRYTPLRMTPGGLRPHATQPAVRGPAREHTDVVDFPRVIFADEIVNARDDIALGHDEIRGDKGIAAMKAGLAEFDPRGAQQCGIVRAREICEGLEIELFLEAHRDV